MNAIAHRDYTSNDSAQVMVFADRVGIWNPGSLPPSLKLAQLSQPHRSVPVNPLLAEPLYLSQYIECLGTGTGDMIRHSREASLSEPLFALDDGFLLTLQRPAASGPTQETTEETTQETTVEATEEPTLGVTASGKPRERIPALMPQRPTITTKELADALHLSVDGVSYPLKELRTDGWIHHQGPTKSGRWEGLS